MISLRSLHSSDNDSFPSCRLLELFILWKVSKEKDEERGQFLGYRVFALRGESSDRPTDGPTDRPTDGPIDGLTEGPTEGP